MIEVVPKKYIKHQIANKNINQQQIHHKNKLISRLKVKNLKFPRL
jgi:hypothetical protein